jgi:hypothetical protein
LHHPNNVGGLIRLENLLNIFCHNRDNNYRIVVNN